MNYAPAKDGTPVFPFFIMHARRNGTHPASQRDILEVCVELGGSITGEHGMGIGKQNEMPLMFSDIELE